MLIVIVIFSWKDALKSHDKKGVHPMEKLIAVAPSVAELVLEKCVITQPNYQLPDQTETKKVIFILCTPKLHTSILKLSGNFAIRPIRCFDFP